MPSEDYDLFGEREKEIENVRIDYILANLCGRNLGDMKNSISTNKQIKKCWLSKYLREALTIAYRIFEIPRQLDSSLLPDTMRQRYWWLQIKFTLSHPNPIDSTKFMSLFSTITTFKWHTIDSMIYSTYRVNNCSISAEHLTFQVRNDN